MAAKSEPFLLLVFAIHVCLNCFLLFYACVCELHAADLILQIILLLCFRGLHNGVSVFRLNSASVLLYCVLPFLYVSDQNSSSTSRFVVYFAVDDDVAVSSCFSCEVMSTA